MNNLDTLYINWVKFNVGGKTFLTSKLSIQKEPSSFLYRLIQDDEQLKTCRDEFGAYMIDRDPRYFPIILNYLRHGKVIIDGNLSEEGVIEEAEFYNLANMIDQIRKKQREKADILENTATRHVYRVLQCSEEELTRTVSNMTDGWRFEQVRFILTQFCYMILILSLYSEN